MKNKNLKKYVNLTLVVLGTVCMMAGCGGNKGDENFTKEEKDEIDAAFSSDERKELEEAFNDSSSDSTASKQYDETITIDPLAHITFKVTGVIPDDARIEITSDDAAFNWNEIDDSKSTNSLDYHIEGYKMSRDSWDLPYFTKEDGEINLGDTVTVTVNWREGKKYPENYEEKIQKNIEFARTTADIQLVAGEDLVKSVTDWNELSDEQKEAFIATAREHANTYAPFDVNDDNVNTMEPVCEFTYTRTSQNIDTKYILAIGFKISDEQILYVGEYNIQYNIITGEITNQVFYNSFSADPGITDMNELATICYDNYSVLSGDKPTMTGIEYNLLQ